MLEVDGSEGGGQLLRSALSFSALTGKPVRVTGIRGARSEGGLRPQHLTAVQLLGTICDADVSDAEVGSEELAFRPGEVQPGRYTADIGTAGSATLLLDTVLPLATVVDEPLVVVRGGTDVKWSPTMAYYRRTKLPLLRRQGLYALVERDRPGFYPAGGGEVTLRLSPSTLSHFEFAERGERTGARVRSLASADLADQSVAERQASEAVERLDGADVSTVERTVQYADTDSTGSALAVRLDYERTLAGFDALGEKGKPAESVAEEAIDAALAFENGTAAVDRHMADQLLTFLALAGRRVRIPAVTDHVETNRALLADFGFDITVERSGDAAVFRA